MVVIRSADEIILNMIEMLKIVQPSADTKPGTVIRDLLIELPASQLGLIYDELANSTNLQSIRVVSGVDLDNLLSNYGLTRKTASKASGLALFTFSSIPAPISINKGDLVFSSNGTSFVVANGVSIVPTNTNLYKSIATKYQNDLDFLSITDQYAIEVTVQATTPGSSSNISKYGLNRTNTVGVSNVTNVFSFNGGTNQEEDASFRNRGLAIFSGSSTGTSIGYRNTALTDSNVLDAVIIEPGNPLMTRDGTTAIENSDGTYTIISEGTGGKVDIIILGQNLSEYIDSFIYQDKSNRNDPTDIKNIFALGQITGDANKTINRRRIDNLANGTVPAQPVQDLLEITGSLSGSNFKPKSIDFLGRVSGNYELIKDTGAFGGSVFGFDKLHWINDQIDLFEEDRIKSKFNGQDNVTFTDVLEIPSIKQNISITNENSLVTPSNKSIIKLLHTPLTNVTRVFNVNTGERYIVTNQNIDGNNNINTTGRIQITGNTLPSTSDVLQVDYTWIVEFDPFIDYDGKIINSNPRESNDSIDWGISNAVKNEIVTFQENDDDAFFSGNVKHPVSVVLSAEKFNQANGTVIAVTTGNFLGRLSVNINELNQELISISNITLQNATLEVYNTIDDDGVFTNERVVVGSEIKYNCTIILPSDTPALVGDSVSIYFNQEDVFTVDSSVGNFSSNQITIPSPNLSISTESTLLRVTYFANVQDALTSSITTLPISRSGNSFKNNTSTGFINNSVSNIVRRENQTIQLNGSSEPIVTLSCTATDFIMDETKIISIVDLNTNNELWNIDNVGTVTTDVNNFYVATLTGFNSPTVGDNVVIFYNADDVKRTQPFTFDNSVIITNIQELQYDSQSSKFFIDLHTFIDDTIDFSVINPTTNIVVGSGSGTIVSNDIDALITGGSFIFSAVDEILFKKIKIENSLYPNNNGIYDIISIDQALNKITISNKYNNINSNQISIIRLLDNKELWNENGQIDLINNKLILPSSTNANINDNVFIIISIAKNLRQAPSRLAVTVADQINNSGIITVAGTTITKVKDIVFTATRDGLRQNVMEAVRQALGLSSSQTIPSNISLARITQVNKVTTTTGAEVLSTDFSYDILGCAINSNIFYANEMVDNDSLSALDFILPATTNNLLNEPKIGDSLQITCYFTTSSDMESLAFTRNGTLYTNKVFSFIDKIYVSSGFTSNSVRFIISYFNQPSTGSRYKAYYNYIAPKQNERIIVRYNHNQLIADTTFNIEKARPINADVLVKSATELLVDLTMNVVIKSDFLTSSATVLQNLKDRLTSAINTNKLGDLIDASDLVTVAQSVDGVDRARVIYFNENGMLGQKLSLIANKNEYFSANNIIVAQETR